MRTGFWFFNHRRTESVFGGSSGAPFPWDNLIFSAVTVVLYLLVAYALVRWLYPPATTTVPADVEGDRPRPGRPATTKPTLPRVGRIRAQEFAPAVMAAALMYGAIHQVVSVMKGVLGIGIMRLVNAILERMSPMGFLVPR